MIANFYLILNNNRLLRAKDFRIANINNNICFIHFIQFKIHSRNSPLNPSLKFNF
jgi:hypothetical protein